MPVFEITSPDGRVLEIEGDKAPSESELDNIFKSIPVESNKGSINQSALSNVKSTDDEPEIGMSIAERFNKLRQDSVQYAANIPQKEAGMSWVEYAKLRKKYDEDWGLNTPDLNPLKSIWKMSILGSVNEKLYRGQKEKRAGKYIDNTEVLTEVPAQALADWEKKGQIKAGEAFIRSDWSRTIPFLGSGTAIDEATDIKKIIDKKNKGEELSKKEITQLNAYILDVAEQNYRGVSFGGKLIQGALELPSFAGEFMATGGLASIGKNAIQKTITRGLQEATKKEVGKRLTKGLLEGAAGAVTRTSLGMPQRVAENYGMRKLHESLGITDKGQVVLETADTSPALTFLKAWGDTVIENWSEEMGAGLGEAAGLSFKSLNKLASPLEKKLFSRDTRAAFIKAMRTLRPNATVKDIMTRAGFNGILEEMGEERAGSVLRVIFGIDDRQDVSTFEKLCEAINPGAEELLLELGLFSIPGSMSFAASQVARHLRNQNVDEQTISDYMKLTSELEKEKFLGDIADNKDLTNAINFENDVRDLKNRYFTQNLNAGLEKEEALAAADIQSNAVSSLAKNIGMDINELNREFAINTQSLTAEQAKAQQQADSLVLRGGVEMNVERHNQPLYQSVEKAGAAENKLVDAAKEWEEKGTESKYFRKWFGNSKVVDENGKPLVVYHGTENGSFEIFSEQRIENGFFFTDDINTAKEYAEVAPFLAEDMTEEEIADASKIYEVYLKIENPYIADMGGEDYRGTAIQGYIDEARELGHDGVIIKNIIDKRYNDSEGSLGTDYIVFNPEQIKSVNNKGTFDSANPNIYYQSAENEERNLLMTHAAKLDMLDNILESGSLVAPSMAITKKGEQEALKNFGDILFVRNPRKIDYQNDNIFDRDIYSPRMPKPSYELENGRIIDSYEYDSLKRMDEERFKKAFGEKDKYLKIKRKVLNLGFTSSGNLKIKPYNANTLLEYMQKNKLLGGENFDYGLSSLLAKLSKQQISKENLKETAKNELSLSNAELTEKYNNLREEYGHFDEKLEPYYIGNGFIYSDLGDIFYAVVKNNKRKLAQYLDMEQMPKELFQEMKDLINEALSLPRSYFEAKPMRKVDLSEFSYALAEKGLLTDVQKKNLELWGVKPIEYPKEKLSETLDNLDKENTLKIYFQSAYHGTPHIVDLTDDFEKSPTIQEVKNYINKIIEEGIKFATANPDFVVDIKGGNRVKKKILNASNYKKLDKMSRKRHNKYIMSLEKLLANAEYSGAKENTKKDKKPNIEKYHYFTTNVKVGSKVYKIVFDTEEYKNENQLRFL